MIGSMDWRRRTFVSSLATISLGGAAMAAARPLERWRWQSRLVVVLAERLDDPLLEAQLRLLQDASDGLLERDMVVVTAAGDVVTIDGREAADVTVESLRAAYAAPGSGSQVLLIGKDGGVKLRSTEPVSTEELFALIDSMPMRRREMQERN